RSSAAPRPGDGEGHAVGLRTHEQGRAVGAETTAGKLRLAQYVERQGVACPLGAHTDQTVVRAGVFAEDQVTPRRDDEVVGVLDQAVVVGFEVQLQSAGETFFVALALEPTGDVAPDLALAVGSA